MEIIKCHGSGNEFIMIDLTVKGLTLPTDMAALARALCCDHRVGRCDGVLYVVTAPDGTYTMRMFNPDGSEAEMCGNGIRCVARLVDQRYLHAAEFTLMSGSRRYPIRRAENIAEHIPAYGADIEVRLTSEDFGFAHGADRFVAREIPSLSHTLKFTALNLGNPHIVACVESIDMDELRRLGQAVTTLHDDFPHGINVSLYKKRGTNAIFAATYERGAGITYSCGTAMTACSTAAVLTGICQPRQDITVYNKGGMVRCVCCPDTDTIVTRLTGNATYEWYAEAEWDGRELTAIDRTRECRNETTAYDTFATSVTAEQ